MPKWLNNSESYKDQIRTILRCVIRFEYPVYIASVPSLNDDMIIIFQVGLNRFRTLTPRYLGDKHNTYSFSWRDIESFYILNREWNCYN